MCLIALCLFCVCVVCWVCVWQRYLYIVYRVNQNREKNFKSNDPNGKFVSNKHNFSFLSPSSSFRFIFRPEDLIPIYLKWLPGQLRKPQQPHSVLMKQGLSVTTFQCGKGRQKSDPCGGHFLNLSPISNSIPQLHANHSQMIQHIRHRGNRDRKVQK